MVGAEGSSPFQSLPFPQRRRLRYCRLNGTMSRDFNTRFSMIQTHLGPLLIFAYSMVTILQRYLHVQKNSVASLTPDTAESSSAASLTTQSQAQRCH